MSENWNTQQTLIQRAQDPDDHDAWNEFVRYYESFIKMVLRKTNLNMSDEDDLIQNILLRVWKGLPKFEYREGKVRFRTWLSRIIRNAFLNHVQSMQGKEKKHDLYQKEVDSISESSIEKIIEKEWNDYIAFLAMEKVKEIFTGNAIEVFRMSLQEKDAKTISSELGIQESTVFVLRNRVKKRLQVEMARLQEIIEIK